LLYTPPREPLVQAKTIIQQHKNIHVPTVKHVEEKTTEEESKYTHKPTLFVPQVVKSFRNRGFDWHSLLKDPRVSQDAAKNAKRLRTVVLDSFKEQMGDLLTTQMYVKHDHGPLSSYEQCKILRDGCMMHDNPTECVQNGFCGWCDAKKLCVDRANPIEECPAATLLVQKLKSAPTDSILQVSARGTLEVTRNIANCTIIVGGARIHKQNLQYEEMYYHWHKDNFQTLVYWLGEQALTDMNTQIILMGDYQDVHFSYFGLVTKFCYRYLRDIAPFTCLSEAPIELPELPKHEPAPQHVKVSNKYAKLSYSEMLIGRLGLLDVKPTRARVGIISRKLKRFILNEDELAAVVRSLGIEVVILPLEEMTLYEQVKELRKITILVGMHGSGLINALFMPSKSALVQLMPYQTRGGNSFFGTGGLSTDVSYHEWTNTKRENSIFHFHFLTADENKKREEILERGQVSHDRQFFSFWINQDTYVDPIEFKELIESIVKKSVFSASGKL
jgi:hypothetical protein